MRDATPFLEFCIFGREGLGEVGYVQASGKG